jgi:predicted dehydrogenase
MKTRRTFLKQAAAGAAALGLPAIVPSSVFGANAPSNRILLGMIGVGTRGSGVMDWFMGNADVQFVAVCDCFGHRRDAAKTAAEGRYGAGSVTAYTDFRELLARDDIEGVVVCTPDHWHVPVATAAARAGKDMYVEKPLGVSMRWNRELARLIDRYGNVFQYGTQQRSEGQFHQACELVRNGYIGTLTRIDAWCPDISSQYGEFHVKEFGSTEPAPVPRDLAYDQWIGPAPMKPYTVDRCTCYGSYHTFDYALGFIAGWGAHPLDIAQWGKGCDHTGPVLYEGTGELPSQGLYDTVSSWDVRCEYADGVAIRFMGHRVAEPVVTAYRPWSDHGTTFFGTDGWVSVDRGRILASDPNILKGGLKPPDIRLKKTRGHERDFLDAIRTREATVNPIESALRSDAISHLSDIAIRTGRAIRWDPEAEQIIGDDVAARMIDRPLRSPWRL